MVFDGNSEVCTAANVQRADPGPAASHKTELARNSEPRNAANVTQVAMDLPASHKTEHARNGAVHCVC